MVRLSVALVFALAVAVEARADLPRLGIFRKKKDDPPAAEKDKAAKARQLVETLRGDPDEKKRLAAVEELADYDSRTHLEVLPALTASLAQDPSATVRASAASAIGAMKPVQQTAGVALEQTNANDPAESVRKAAQQALWQYHLNGYRSAGNVAAPQTAEPPLAGPKPRPAPAVPIAAPAKPATVPATTVSNTKPATEMPGRVHVPTAEPPLAKPKPVVQPPVPSLTVPPLPAAPTVPVTPAPKPPAVPPPPGR